MQLVLYVFAESLNHPPRNIRKGTEHLLSKLVNETNISSGDIINSRSEIDHPNKDSNQAVKVISDNNNKENDNSIVQKGEIQAAVKMGYKKWNRSKICLVGEGRAGKTATANTIIGLEYKETKSTIGITEMTCDVKHAYASSENDEMLWIQSTKAEKELEEAIAFIILEERRSQQKHENNENKSNLPSKSSAQSNSKLTNNNVNAKLSSIPVIGSEASAAYLHYKPTAPPVTGYDNSKIMSLLSDKADISGDLKISVYDYGGQDVFASIHHLFLTRYGVYAVVFNMEWLVNSNNDDGMSSQQCLSYIKFWLNAIAMHTYSALNGSIAPIILIGTRKDKVPDTKDHVRISLLLYNTFKLHIAWRSVSQNENGNSENGLINLCFFPIDNVKGRIDESVKSLIRTVNNIMSESDYIHKEVPLTWLQTVDKFSEMIGDQPWLSYDAAVAVAISCGVVNEEIVDMLEFLHEMGFLLWNQDEQLKALIVLDPILFFVKPATNVICKHSPTEEDPNSHFLKIHKKCFVSLPYEWNDMIEKGVVSSNLLNMLLSECSFTALSVIQLMIKYGLIVPFTYSYNHISSCVVTEYLVPSIIPPMPSNLSHQKDEEWNHVGYFVFTTDPRLFDHDYISKSELQTKGFLPKGLFERLVCKAVTWSQYSSPSALSSSHSQIYKDFIISFFGSQRFRLRSLPDWNCVEISTMGSNPLPVMNRAYDLIVKLIRECMKNLHCFKAVQYLCDNNDGRKMNAPFIADDDSEVMIPLSRLVEIASDDLNRPPLSLPGRKSLNKTEILSLYGSWIKFRGPKPVYDGFISYRWGYNDSRFAKALFDSISNYYNVDATEHRSVEVFLDTDRLENGTHLQQSFISSLINSYVVTPIISKNALHKMVTHNPNETDNLLVEWITAMECLHINKSNNNGMIKLMRIFPIMLGSVSDDGKLIGNLFTDGILNNLPEIVPTLSVNKVMELMALNGLQPRTNITQRTVRSFIEELKSFLGYGAWEGVNHRSSKSVVEICANKIVDVIQQVINGSNQEVSNTNDHLNNNIGAHVGIIKNNQPSNLVNVSFFNIQDWLLQHGLEDYYDQFIASGIDKKIPLLQLKKDAGGNLTALKESLSEVEVVMKPMHAKLLLNALNDLN
eukprot:gene10757-14446_t